MADYAHKMTDLYIKRMERGVSDVYSRASKEVNEKLNDFYRRYRKKDDKWRQWVDQGRKTKEEYREWRKGQLLAGQRWENMKDSLANDYRNADKIAEGIVRRERAGVYALNHNWSTYEIEKTLSVDTSYTLYTREGIEKILAENPRMLPPPGKIMGKAIRDGKTKVWTKNCL